MPTTERVLTREEVAEIEAGVAECEEGHKGKQYPFCENFGCMSLRPLLNHIRALEAERDEALKHHRKARYVFSDGSFCVGCQKDWPCPTVAALSSSAARVGTEQ